MRRSEYPASLPDEGFARRPTIENVTGMRHAKLYGMIGEGTFPRPVKVGNVSLWRVEQVRDWIADPAGWRQATAETA